MTNEDAAELGVYAAELFRFVSPAQKHSVAEQMLPLRDVVDEYDAITTSAIDVGRGILRQLAGTAGDEQRLHVSAVRDAVHDHMRRHGYPPADPVPNAWKTDAGAVSAARAADDEASSWADRLTDEQAAELTAEALKQVEPHAHYLFANKDVRTSRVLRILARDHYRKAHAFD